MVCHSLPGSATSRRRSPRPSQAPRKPWPFTGAGSVVTTSSTLPPGANVPRCGLWGVMRDVRVAQLVSALVNRVARRQLRELALSDAAIAQRIALVPAAVAARQRGATPSAM
jgi:hypothetical protein